MGPLHVTCHLAGGQVVLPTGTLALDALAMAAVAIRDRLPPPRTGEVVPPLDIPIAKSACERIYLASEARPAVAANELRYTNRRFPAREALRLTAMKRVDVAAGPQKSYRLPYTASHVAGDRLEWWCLGDAPALEGLLAFIHFVGKKRGTANGRVARWEVAPVADPWDGFPVLRAGRPLRPLPLDWPGLVDYEPAYRVLLPPLWDRAREEACAVSPS